MGKIKEFCLKYKKDLFAIFLLLTVFILCTALSLNYFGNLYYDCGREVMTPQWMLEGKILYKDIFGMYNPLSYQINTLLYTIFGISFNTLRIAGAFNAFLILICCYFILRIFSHRFYAFSICVLIMSVYMFSSVSCINYIFPYAYAFPYALNCFLWSVLFFLLWEKYEKSEFLFISALCLGFSLANKPEFALCILPVLGILLYKKVPVKHIILSAGLIAAPLVISWGILFLQGFTVSDMQNYIIFIHKFFNTTEQHMYNLYVAPSWNFISLKTVMFDFLMFAGWIISGYLFFLLCKKRTMFAAVIVFPFFTAACLKFIKYLFVEQHNIFSWSVIACIVVLLFNLKKFKEKQFLLLNTILIFAIFSCARTNFLLIHQYRIFLGILPLVALFISIYMIMNKYTQKSLLLHASPSFLLYFAAIFFIFLASGRYNLYMTIETSKGAIAAPKLQAIPFKAALDWTYTHTKPDDTIVMLPEGPMINYITGRPTNALYYHLIPNHIKAIGEEKIVNDFAKDKPDYFMINNADYKSYGAKCMCKDFGFKICTFIYNNYDFVTRFDTKSRAKLNYEYIDVYKLKQ